MQIVPKIRFTASPQRPACAWLLPGTEASQWFEELQTWQAPLDDASCYLLPRPANFQECLGLLVTFSSQNLSIRTRRALAFGCLSPRVFVPLDALCEPPLSDDDWRCLLPPTQDQYLWHPAAGWIALNPNLAFSIGALLRAPQRIERDWTAAQPGVAVNERLLSIQPLTIPTLQDIVRLGQGDIGTQDYRHGELPPAPGEPIGGSIGQAMAQAGLTGAALAVGGIAALAKTLTAAARAIGAGQLTAAAKQATAPAASNSGWLQSLRNWASQRQQNISSRLEALRNRQVERLLNMLTTAPDEGLRFALSLSGGNHRGLAQPGAGLTERDVSFDLARLGGGGPADFWQLSAEMRLRLMNRYRELADRELSLRRYRRAAYIFAELLGDLQAAANALASGGHYREAAIIYEQRLRNALAAAKCLQQGGLLAEAVTIYERLNQWETVGEIYTQLQQPSDAEQAYRTAVNRLIAGQAYLEAAQLLEHKLQAPEEAYDALLLGWPHSPTARSCLDASFQWLARHQRHDQAALKIQSLREEHSELFPADNLAAAFVKISAEYPATNVRKIAENATRVIVSQRLATANLTEAHRLLQSLAQLVPADKLLARDCQRFEDAQRAHLASAPPWRQRRHILRTAATIRLPPARWTKAVSIGETFYAAGWLKDHLIVARGNWKGAIQLPVADFWRVPAEYQNRPVMMAADPRGLHPLYIHLQGASVRMPPAIFPATDAFRNKLAVEPHPGCDENTITFDYGLGGSELVGKLTLDDRDNFLLQVTPYALGSLQPGSIRIPLPDTSPTDNYPPLLFLSRGSDIILGYGDRLLSHRGTYTITRLPHTIRQITGSPPHSRSRIIVACEQGGFVVWGNEADAARSFLASELFEPVIGMNRGGRILAATRDEIQLYSTLNGNLLFQGKHPGPKINPLAVLPTDDTSTIAVVTEDGTVTVYEATT